MGNSSHNPQQTAQQISEVYSLCSQEIQLQSKISRKGQIGTQKLSKSIVNQLFQSFQRYPQYSWGEEILPLFKQYLQKDFDVLWKIDKQKFYQILCDSCGITKQKSKGETFQSFFYNYGPGSAQENMNSIMPDDGEKKLKALNSSILDESEVFPLIASKRNTHSMIEKVPIQMSEYALRSEISRAFSEHHSDFQIERSSMIIPQTVFIDRLTEEQRDKVDSLLSIYKNFSNSLQMMIRTINILSCPIKHFEASLKKKVKKKKIRKARIPETMLEDTREAAITRKNKQSNNCMLLLEIRDFIDAYTQFVWKYLDLYMMGEGALEDIITLDSASGIVLKVVWSFSGWIGDRGSQWQEMQLGKSLQKFSKLQNSKIVIPESVIFLACEMRNQKSPQKYLKNIVIIYRELGKICENADELLVYYEKLIYQIIAKNCHQKLFRMISIIDKLMKMGDTGGEIGYAWTTWNIIIQFLRKSIQEEEKKLIHQENNKLVAKM